MRTASCACGELSISVDGEPDHVFICHCRDCQRATGAAFGVSVYWPKTSIRTTSGQGTAFTRGSQSGRTLTHHFCPVCGGRPYWFADFFPDHVGVAFGCLDRQDVPPPTDEYWTLRKHPWAALACSLVSHEGDD